MPANATAGVDFKVPVADVAVVWQEGTPFHGGSLRPPLTFLRRRRVIRDRKFVPLAQVQWPPRPRIAARHVRLCAFQDTGRLAGPARRSSFFSFKSLDISPLPRRYSWPGRDRGLPLLLDTETFTVIVVLDREAAMGTDLWSAHPVPASKGRHHPTCTTEEVP